MSGFIGLWVSCLMGMGRDGSTVLDPVRSSGGEIYIYGKWVLPRTFLLLIPIHELRCLADYRWVLYSHRQVVPFFKHHAPATSSTTSQLLGQ